VPFSLGIGENDIAQLLKLGLIDEQTAGTLRCSLGKSQPMSLMFTMTGVDFAAARPWLFKHPTCAELGIDDRAFAEEPFIGVEGLEAGSNGELPLPQKRILFTPLSDSGDVLVNMTRITGRDGTRAADLTEATVLAYKQARAVINILRRYIPGFAQARLKSLAPEIGVRETRRFRGVYTLTGSDVYSARRFPDRVARGSYPIDIHDPSGTGAGILAAIKGPYYDIPYRCLYAPELDNLLLAGRCISADYVANSSARIAGTCMLIGQAAGTAAAEAAKAGLPIGSVDVSALQASLQTQGVYLAESESPSRGQ
jgi:hypothetical protein